MIDTDGTVETGRKEGKTGAHVKGHNLNSLGICLVGGITKDKRNHDKYTEAKWKVLLRLLRDLEAQISQCSHLWTS